MANEIYLAVRGNLGRDPELSRGKNGEWVRFSVGVSSRVWNGESYSDRPTQWFDVRAYGSLAMNTALSVRRGDSVLVRGELRTDTWMDNGVERSKQYIRADSVALDLRYAAAKPIKFVDRDSQEAPASAEQNPLESLAPVPSGSEEVSGWDHVPDVTDATEIVREDREAPVA